MGALLARFPYKMIYVRKSLNCRLQSNVLNCTNNAKHHQKLKKKSLFRAPSEKG